MRHIVDNVVESVDGIHQLIVLCGDISHIGVRAIPFRGFEQCRPGRVGKRTGLTHFLEHYRIHRAAEIFVVNLGGRMDCGIEILAFVGEHRHVKLFRIIRSHEHHCLFRLLGLIALEIGRLLQFHTLHMMLVKVGHNLLFGQRAVVDDAVAEAEHVAERLGNSFGSERTELLLADGGILHIIGTIVHICAQTREILPLVGFGIGTRLHFRINERAECLSIRHSLVNQLLK